jgi:Leu/Phe-tRNA-protein transferase
MRRNWRWRIWWMRLRAGGFTLFDTQFLTPHLASLGGSKFRGPSITAAFLTRWL